MDKYHVIVPGDCISSLAYENGLLPEKIWNHSENSELRQKCRSMNHLIPGERIFIPAVVRKNVSKSTESTHTFKLRGVPEIYRVQLLDPKGEPRAYLKYLITIDGIIQNGVTDGEGKISHLIPPNAAAGQLQIFDGDDEEIYELEFGHLEPVSELAGIQMRLTNLGCDCLEEKGKMGEKTRRCLLKFQAENNLEATGEPDEPTQIKLKDVYGS